MRHRALKPGDPAPTGYLEWHEWAEVQHKAGLRQEQCAHCLRWFYPQECSGERKQWTGKTAKGREVRGDNPVCIGCAARKPHK